MGISEKVVEKETDLVGKEKHGNVVDNGRGFKDGERGRSLGER